MIIVIRGTNGSGKSHAVREMMKHGYVTREDLPEGSCLMKLKRIVRPVLFIGPYEQGRSMGGCDCIRQPSKIYDLIMWAENRRFHAVLEGVVLATRPYMDFYRRGFDVRYAFLDPPFETCLENIRKRQKKRGHESPFSQDAMRYKLSRATDMWRKAREIGMITKRFTTSVEVMQWSLSQLRSA